MPWMSENKWTKARLAYQAFLTQNNGNVGNRHENVRTCNKNESMDCSQVLPRSGTAEVET